MKAILLFLVVVSRGIGQSRDAPRQSGPRSRQENFKAHMLGKSNARRQPLTISGAMPQRGPYIGLRDIPGRRVHRRHISVLPIAVSYANNLEHLRHVSNATASFNVPQPLPAYGFACGHR